MNTAAATAPTTRIDGPGPLTESAALTLFVSRGDSPAAHNTRRTIVTAFTHSFTNLNGWHNASLSIQLAATVEVRGLVVFLLLITGRPVSADYVRSCRSEWGYHASLLYPEFSATLHNTALALGFDIREARRQWCTLAKIAVTAGISPNSLNTNTFRMTADALTTAHAGPGGKIPIGWSTPCTDSKPPRPA